MKQVTTCLGVLLLLLVCTSALVSAQQADQRNSAAAPTASDSNPAASKSQTPQKKANDGFDRPSGHGPRVRLGGIAVSGSYTHYSGFYPYPFAYDPFYYPFSAVSMSMFWHPFWGYYPPFYPDGYFGPGNAKGELKLTGAPKDASVYVNGAYAGTVAHLKSFWLEPGAYDLAVTTADGRRFQQRVYMLTGKTLKLEAKPMEKPKEGENL